MASLAHSVKSPHTARFMAKNTHTTKTRFDRLPLVGLGIVSLACGVWAGLIRLPLNLTIGAGQANWITYHGALMVCGFLGTVIALERAVGLRQWWTYVDP